MTNLDSIFKSRDITLPTKVCLVKAMIFPVVMYGCERWTVKKAECWRIDAFELRCWRRLLRVPWTARRSNQSILKEISPGISLEGMMLKLKLQYFGHHMWRVDSLEKTLMLGGIGGRRRGRQRMRSLDGITDSMDWVWVNSWSWWWTGRPGMLWFMGSQRVGRDWTTGLIWTELRLELGLIFSILSTYLEVYHSALDKRKLPPAGGTFRSSAGFTVTLSSQGPSLGHFHGPVVNTQCFKCRECGFNMWLEN